jgi:hypothetical protein
VSQAINLRAVRWAYEQEGLNVTAKAVLLSFALHANERGYSWPSVDRIASTWPLDERTVRRQIEALLVRRLICRTKKRCGFTGQVKVYRLPKITWESGAKMHPFENNENGDKGGHKAGISPTKMHPEQVTKKTRTLPKGSKTLSLLSNNSSSDSFLEGLDSEAREAVHYYNSKLARRGWGWLPVNKLTPRVKDVLARFAHPEGIQSLVNGVLENSPSVKIPKTKSLTRLCWENYTD